MGIKDLAVGMFAFDFRYYVKGPLRPKEKMIVTVMANTEEDARQKFTDNVLNVEPDFTVDVR